MISKAFFFLFFGWTEICIYIEKCNNFLWTKVSIKCIISLLISKVRDPFLSPSKVETFLYVDTCGYVWLVDRRRGGGGTMLCWFTDAWAH